MSNKPDETVERLEPPPLSESSDESAMADRSDRLERSDTATPASGAEEHPWRRNPLDSFRYALEGIIAVVRTQRHMR
ncbi:MAG: hypothetical protein NZL85_02160, partial [Fimbriimonadales bacterium]|nr:hypothetical protein [Fimbriimonadales bacterium]